MKALWRRKLGRPSFRSSWASYRQPSLPSEPPRAWATARLYSDDDEHSLTKRLAALKRSRCQFSFIPCMYMFPSCLSCFKRPIFWEFREKWPNKFWGSRKKHYLCTKIWHPNTLIIYLKNAFFFPAMIWILANYYGIHIPIHCQTSWTSRAATSCIWPLWHYARCRQGF